MLRKVRLDDAIFEKVFQDLKPKTNSDWKVVYTKDMICLSRNEDGMYVNLCMRSSLLDRTKIPELVTLDYAYDKDSIPHHVHLSLVQKAKVWYRFKSMIRDSK